jgi:hypothetical protein
MAVVLTQVAVVVRDLEPAMEAYSRVLGWGHWRVYDFNELPHTDTTVRGEPVNYTMRTAVPGGEGRGTAPHHVPGRWWLRFRHSQVGRARCGPADGRFGR